MKRIAVLSHARSLGLAVSALLVLGSGALHAASNEVEVLKSPYCGCCGKWVEHMRQAGFKLKVTEVKDTGAQRERLKMPQAVASCHTATVGGYALEGHIPAADVQRLLKEKPKARGIAVPSMPPGSPGMEGPQSLPYDTLLVKLDGSTAVFAKH